MKSNAQATIRMNITNMNDHDTKEIHLFSIATDMKKTGLLSDHFIVSAVHAAFKYEGVMDLMELWENEKNVKERDEIIADIQEILDDSVQKDVTNITTIRFNDLDMVSKNIRAFKDSLLSKVMEQGGVSRLAELTGIPQPSLSRFFNTNTVPRRSTLLKIAKALNMDELQIEKIFEN